MGCGLRRMKTLSNWTLYVFLNCIFYKILCFVDRVSLYNLFQMNPTGCTLLLVYLFQLLYLFRTNMCPSSGEFTVSMRHRYFYSLWVVVLIPTSRPDSHPYRLKKMHLLQWIRYNSLYIWSSPFTSCPHSWRALLSTTVAAPCNSQSTRNI